MTKKKKQSKPKKIPTPSNLQKGPASKAVAQIQSEQFSGPLPPPMILDQYNKIVDGSADRIIAMAERQSAHRQKLESFVIESDKKNSRLGLHYGFLIGIAAITGAVLCILNGYQLGGGILGTMGLGGLVSVFVYGSQQRRKEREERFKRSPEQVKAAG